MTVFTVDKLNNYIKNVFEDEFVLSGICVTGEVTQINYNAKNTFFELSGGGATISSIFFGVNQHIAKGAKINCFGAVRFYAKSGKVSLCVNSVKPVGEGEKYAEFVRLREQLRAEGVFDNRPRLPFLIGRVAIVTSRSGAVLHDFVSVCAKNAPRVDIMLFDARVQGDKSSEDMACAIEQINQHIHCDVIVLARGGGSNFDLSAFNTERLSRAVSASKIPVISAVGHETDYTLVDLAASVRAGTPSIAAQIVCSVCKNAFDRAFFLSKRLDKAAETLCNGKIAALKRVNSALAYNGLNKTERLFERVRRLNERVFSLTEGVILQNEKRAEKLAICVKMLDPFRLVKGGYARVFVGGEPLVSVEQLQGFSKLSIYLSDGVVTASVDDVERVKRD